MLCLQIEKSFNFKKFRTDQIKEAYFLLYRQDSITLQNIHKGIQNLQLIQNQETQDNFSIFIYSFQNKDENDTVLQDDFNFHALISVFFMLSKSHKYQKASDIFDLLKSESIVKQDLFSILSAIFNCILLYSAQFTKQELKNDPKNIEKLVNFFFDNKEQIDKPFFIQKILQFRKSKKYDIMKPQGIRKYMMEEKI